MFKSAVLASSLAWASMAVLAGDAHAQEWRFCMGADQVGDNMKAPLMFTNVFRSDLVQGYEQQYAAHVARNLTITGEVSVACTDPYPTQEAATGKMIEWLDLMTNGEVAIEVVSARWEPTYAAEPTSAPATAAPATAATPSDLPSTPRVTAESQAPQPSSATGPSREQQQQAEERRRYWEQQRAGTAGASAVGGSAATKPLRFRFSVGLRPRMGDTINPSCTSNIITRPGPAGWGSPGFLPTGTAEQAISTIDGLKEEFMTKCRTASGREIDGMVHHRRNQSEQDEAELNNFRAPAPEDVVVHLD